MVSDILRSPHPNKNQVERRIIDITNLNGNVIQLTLWDVMAKNFDIESYNSMPKPVMIVVTSCRVQEYRSQLQLIATQATHYYLNPNIPEVTQALPEYKEKFEVNPPLPIIKQKSQDFETEKTRNRFPLSKLLIQNPDSYKSVRFTCKGSVVSLSTNDNWFHYSCKDYNKKLISYTPPLECRDHGSQPIPDISFCFRATVKDASDDTTTTPFVFFTPNAEAIVNIDCWKLVNEQGYSDPTKIPPPLEAIKGKTHIFQFHFNSSSKKGSVEFVFDALLDDPNTFTDSGKRPVFHEHGDSQEMDNKRAKITPT